MNNKLLLKDLVDKLSAAEDIKKKEAEEFLRIYFKVIDEGLLKDRIVKINGIGTFKLIIVEARNSVDVNTGQALRIKEHLKLNYLPDATLKDCVNKPFAVFEPIEVEQLPETDHSVIKKTKEAAVHNITELTDEPQINHSDMENPEKNHEGITEIEEIMDKTPEKRRGGGGSFGKIFLILFVIVVVAGMAYWAMKSNNDARKDQDQKIGIIQRFKELFSKDSVIVLPDIVYPDSLTAQLEVKVEMTDSVCPFPDTTRQYPLYVNLRTGNRLTLLALKYYGHKVFWVYVYLDNKDVIDNPNNIPVGTILRISKPHPVLMDPNNPVAIKKAMSLQTRIINKFK